MTPKDLASQLRQIARHLDRATETARPPEPAATAGLRLVAAGALLFFDGDAALARARDFGGRGFAGGGHSEGRGKGSHSSPTEAAAFNPDGFGEAGDTLRTTMGEAVSHAEAAAKQAHRLLSTAPPANDVDGARCGSAPFGCGDLAVKAGYCARCYDWLRNHPEDQHVPEREFVARRRRQRLAS